MDIGNRKTEKYYNQSPEALYLLMKETVFLQQKGLLNLWSNQITILYLALFEEKAAQSIFISKSNQCCQKIYEINCLGLVPHRLKPVGEGSLISITFIKVYAAYIHWLPLTIRQIAIILLLEFLLNIQ